MHQRNLSGEIEAGEIEGQENVQPRNWESTAGDKQKTIDCEQQTVDSRN